MKIHDRVIGPGGQELVFVNADPSDPKKGLLAVEVKGSKVAQQLTQANAVGGTLTFAKNIDVIEIYNVDATNDGVFNVNGMNITVPKGRSFKASIGGTPRITVTVTGSTSYIVTRYE